MRTAGTVTTTTLFSLNRFRQNIREIIGTFESYVKGQQSTRARRATQGYAVQLRRATECCYVELLRGATHCSAELRSATQSCIELRRATLCYMLRSAVLRSAMLSYIVLPCRTTVRCADLRCASQCHAELRSQSYAMLCRAMLCYNELRYVKLRVCYALLCCSTQRHVELRSAATRFYAVLRRATLHYTELP